MTAETARRSSPTSADSAHHRSSRFARFGRLPPWLLVTELFIGLGWARAAAEKVISVDWWTGEAIRDFVEVNDTRTLTWFGPIVDLLVVPLAPFVAAAILCAQVVAALSLLTHRRLAAGLAIGAAMNVSFLALGAVDPSAFYLLAQGAMGLWLVERSAATPALSRRLRFAASGAVALAAVSAIDISTLHPAAAHHEPALMLATAAPLTVIACELAHRRRFGRGLP